MAKNRKKLGSFDNPQLNNASKTLLANIRFASIDERVKTIAVTSTISDEGKTTVSTNLATAIATSGKRVLIVDADMRRRCIAKLLNVHPSCGLYAVLSGQATLNQAIIPTDIPNLYFMDSEPNVPNPPDILSTKRFSVLVENLRESFDYVIFDTPPVSLFVDAAVIGNLVDGTLFVIRQGFAKRTMTQNCIQQLNAANTRILGTVMTFCDNEESDYYYAYYNHEGKRMNKETQEQRSVVPEGFNDVSLNAWQAQAGIKATEPTARRARRNEPTQTNTNGSPANPYETGAFRSAYSSNKTPRHKGKRI